MSKPTQRELELIQTILERLERIENNLSEMRIDGKDRLGNIKHELRDINNRLGEMQKSYEELRRISEKNKMRMEELMRKIDMY